MSLFSHQFLTVDILTVGYGVGYDDVVIHGSLDDLKFAAFYTVYV